MLCQQPLGLIQVSEVNVCIYVKVLWADSAISLHSDGYRFDQSSYFGRVRHFLTMMDPRNVFTSDEKLKKSIELVESYRKGNLPPGITDKDLWNAKQSTFI